MAEYKVERMQTTVYIDKSGQAINGFLATVSFPEFDEVHDLKVPNDKPETVKKAAEAFLDNRRKIAELGG